MPDDDTFSYLPYKPLTIVSKGECLYGPDAPPKGLYLLMSGSLQIIGVRGPGLQTILRVVAPNRLFGEAALIGASASSETAIALERSAVMFWPTSQIYALLERSPRLALGIARNLFEHCAELQRRIESMSIDPTPERVEIGLLQLAGQLGVPTKDGKLIIKALTQQDIARYVGTSREMVSTQMNRLRRLGEVAYTRKSIQVNMSALRSHLKGSVSRLQREAQTASAATGMTPEF